MNRNVYATLCLFLFSVVIAFSGTQYWDDGEIVRGSRINVALDEKVDLAGTNYIRLTPTGTFATAAAEIGTMYQNASGAINYLSTGTTWMTLLATTTGLEW